MRMTSIDVVEWLRKHYAITNQVVKEFLAEFLGTFLLIVFGNGAVAQSVLTAGSVNNYFSVVWGYSLGVVMGVLVSGNVSGGHINPAVTFAMALWGKLPWSKVPVYMVAQYLGAFAASVCLYGVYTDALHTYEPTHTMATAGIWATYPGTMINATGTNVESYLTAGNGFGDQVFGTMLLLICVCAINDRRNMNVPQWICPLFVGFAVMNIGLSFGFNCGFALNPARDLAPRFFTMIAGWGSDPFTATTFDGVSWWWIPVVAPHVGAVLGILVYTIFIDMHHKDTKEPELPKTHANNHNVTSGVQDHCKYESIHNNPME